MSEERIVRYSRDKLPKDGQTDWARVKAMTEEEIDAAARSDPDAQPTDAAFWEDAVVVFPSKKMVCLRIDQACLWGQIPVVSNVLNALGIHSTC